MSSTPFSAWPGRNIRRSRSLSSQLEYAKMQLREQGHELELLALEEGEALEEEGEQ